MNLTLVMPRPFPSPARGATGLVSPYLTSGVESSATRHHGSSAHKHRPHNHGIPRALRQQRSRAGSQYFEADRSVQTLARGYFLDALLTATKSKGIIFSNSITVTELSRTSRTVITLCGCICLRYLPASIAGSFRSRCERDLPSTLISKPAP